MRTLAITLALIACKSDKAEKMGTPPVKGGAYSDLVKATQSGSATETRSSLACAGQISVQPRPARPVQDGRTTEDFESLMRNIEARLRQLDVVPGEALVREATPDELVDSVMRRLMKSLDEPMQMTGPERDLWLSGMYEGEVFNGGHHQFFFNSSGDDAIETRDAIARIGPPEVSRIVACALTAFPDDKPDRDREKRNDQLARWGELQFEIFGPLDTAFYAMEGTTAAKAAYIRAHIAEMPNASRPLAR